MKTESQPQGCLKYLPFLRPFIVIDKPIEVKPLKVKFKKLYFKPGPLVSGEEFTQALKEEEDR